MQQRIAARRLARREQQLKELAWSKDLVQIFGAHLRKVRRNAGISQEDLAREARMDRTFLSRIECGSSLASIATVCRLSQALDMKFSELVQPLDNVKVP
jgi:transcriptional regulator with XRE-family HTH domain